MPWFKVTVSVNDLYKGLDTGIQNEFDSLFIAAGRPEDAALFANRMSPAGIELYFSPRASRFAYRLIAQYGGVPCAEPSGNISLIGGHRQTGGNGA
jgi:hypothetical protein